MESEKDQDKPVDESQQNFEFFANSEPGWEKEALSVIKDVEDHVKSIEISKLIKVLIKIYQSILTTSLIATGKLILINYHFYDFHLV